MMAQNENTIRNDLSEKGRQLLRIIIDHVSSSKFTPGDPSTYLGYMECCVGLGVAPQDENLHWGRLLQQHGLTDLNEWTKQHNLPRVTGLIVNQSGNEKYWPGGDYFISNGHQNMDGVWWEDQAKQASKFNWQPYI